MHLCVSDVQPSLRTTEKSAVKMSIDLKDRFSNTSILSILTRSYTRTTPVGGNNNNDSSNNSINDSNANVNSSSNSNGNNNSSGATNPSLNSISASTTMSPKDSSNQKQHTRVNGRDTVNESPKVSTLFSRFNITSSITNLNPRPKMLGKRISKGPGSNIYVRIEDFLPI